MRHVGYKRTYLTLSFLTQPNRRLNSQALSKKRMNTLRCVRGEKIGGKAAAAAAAKKRKHVIAAVSVPLFLKKKIISKPLKNRPRLFFQPMMMKKRIS